MIATKYSSSSEEDSDDYRKRFRRGSDRMDEGSEVTDTSEDKHKGMPEMKHNTYRVRKTLNSDNESDSSETSKENDLVSVKTSQIKEIVEKYEHIYNKEQKEFIEWAKSEWTILNKSRFMYPEGSAEKVYQQLLRIHFWNQASLKRHYEFVTHIEMNTGEKYGDISFIQDLVAVEREALPKLALPHLYNNPNLFHKPDMPKHCEVHPTGFTLPDFEDPTDLPLHEVYEELARYAARYNVQCIMSEEAATRIVEEDRSYTLPIYVRSLLCADGETRNIVVVGDEVIRRKPPIRTRIYSAMQYLIFSKFRIFDSEITEKEIESRNLAMVFEGLTTEEDPIPAKRARIVKPDPEPNVKPRPVKEKPKKCTCEDGNQQPKRSFRLWRITRASEVMHIIVWCEHKCQSDNMEYLLEPIPEYQVRLGGADWSQHKKQSLALSLYLRQSASVLQVRVESDTGEMVCYDILAGSELDPHNEGIKVASHFISNLTQHFTTLPLGEYMLVNMLQPPCGAQLSIFKSCHTPAEYGFSLSMTNTEISPEEDLNDIRIPPNLGPALLPHHMAQRRLPLAFPGKEIVVQNPIIRPVRNILHHDRQPRPDDEACKQNRPSGSNEPFKLHVKDCECSRYVFEPFLLDPSNTSMPPKDITRPAGGSMAAGVPTAEGGHAIRRSNSHTDVGGPPNVPVTATASSAPSAEASRAPLDAFETNAGLSSHFQLIPPASLNANIQCASSFPGASRYQGFPDLRLAVSSPGPREVIPLADSVPTPRISPAAPSDVVETDSRGRRRSHDRTDDDDTEGVCPKKLRIENNNNPNNN